jgi:hypothetical protein
MFGGAEGELVLAIITCVCLVVVAGVPQKVLYVLPEKGMEQQLACFEKRLILFSDHDGPNQKRRAQGVEVLTD